MTPDDVLMYFYDARMYKLIVVLLAYLYYNMY